MASPLTSLQFVKCPFLVRMVPCGVFKIASCPSSVPLGSRAGGWDWWECVSLSCKPGVLSARGEGATALPVSQRPVVTSSSKYVLSTLRLSRRCTGEGGRVWGGVCRRQHGGHVSAHLSPPASHWSRSTPGELIHSQLWPLLLAPGWPFRSQLHMRRLLHVCRCGAGHRCAPARREGRGTEPRPRAVGSHLALFPAFVFPWSLVSDVLQSFIYFCV